MYSGALLPRTLLLRTVVVCHSEGTGVDDDWDVDVEVDYDGEKRLVEAWQC